MLAVTLGAGAILGYAVARDPLAAVKLAFDTDILLTLFIVNVVVLAWRAYAAWDAYRLTVPHGLLAQSTLTGAATLIGLVLLVPHLAFAYYDLVQYDLITSVFTADTTTTRPPATTEPPPSTTPSTTSSPQTTSQATPAPTTTTTTTTTTTLPPRLWEGQDRLNILLLGSDAGIGRTGVRTDTMVVVSIAPETGDLALFSLPRNLAQVPLPESVDIWACDCFPLILNELYGYGESHPDGFPGQGRPGANAIKGGIGELLGIPIHYYALVALDGFVDLVDAVGGVTMTVTERVYDPIYPHEDGSTEVIDFQPGEYDFDGHQALAYARSRYSSDDYNRMGRQRCVVEAMVKQASPFDLLRGFPAIAEALKRSLETDIPLERIPDLIELLPDVDIEGAVSVRLIPPTYIRGRNAGGYPLPNVERIREHVAIVMDLPPGEAILALGIEPLADACD
jgi:LCP family protein required for cell wall assembly